MATCAVVIVLSSPRPWRCFRPYRAGFLQADVFSTPVEVFPPADMWELASIGLLHARGGVSAGGYVGAGEYLSSPRPWRCFQFRHHAISRWRVFSTPVEVFPSMAYCQIRIAGLLHARGGVSKGVSPA